MVAKVPKTITAMTPRSCPSSNFKCITTPTPIGTKSNDKYPSKLSDVWMTLLAQIFKVISFRRIQKRKPNKRTKPITGPGIFISKYF